MVEDVKVTIKVKLAALWSVFMFFYSYVDYFGLYKPDYINNILAGKVLYLILHKPFSW
jgi:hypothetical protein